MSATKAKAPSINQLAYAYISSKDGGGILAERDFKNLFNRLRPGLVSYSNNILKDVDAAEDVVTDAFVKIWSKIHTYDPRWSFSTWCYKIVRNETMQYLRKQKQILRNGKHYSISSGEQGFIDALMREAEQMMRGTSEPADFTEFDTPVITTEELYQRVMSEIEALPEHYRSIMINREVDKMKYSDIAKEHGLEINTVKTRIIRAREKVCEQLQIHRHKQIVQ